MIIFDFVNSLIPRPLLEDLSDELVIIAGLISVIFEYYGCGADAWRLLGGDLLQVAC